eukprot:CAMPEP_0194385890 /NCGR_PEP_ID=MMETSP0174-20130528/83141_1 /TAXON_ID=216777 /ORGANISM="Proboscia alata, Strain PI-D3" /LENGTH=42 /DNA_ID= /DNA_START= /DNA_END= /DNA_ORIENTATION=
MDGGASLSAVNNLENAGEEGCNGVVASVVLPRRVGVLSKSDE